MDFFGRLDSVRQLAEVFKAVDVAALSTHEGALQDLVAEVMPQAFMASLIASRKSTPRWRVERPDVLACEARVKSPAYRKPLQSDGKLHFSEMPRVGLIIISKRCQELSQLPSRLPSLMSKKSRPSDV